MRTPRDRSKFRQVHVRPETSQCPVCGEELRFLWNGQRFVSFVGSRLHIDYHIHTCVKSGCAFRGRYFRPEFLTTRVLPQREFGLDVVSLVDAVELALPGVPHGLCQYHFLKNFAREVTAIDSQLNKQLAGGLRVINLFENAAEATPSNRPTETDIAGPASLTVGAQPPKEKRGEKGGAGGSTTGSTGRRAPRRRSSCATAAR